MGISCSMLQNFQGKGPVGRCGHRWEGNIKMVLKEVEWVAEDRDEW
jgi:hypothetical protein